MDGNGCAVCGGVVSNIVADLRTSTSLLGQRIESLSKRVEAVAGDTAAPNEQTAVRLAALAGDVAAQGDAVEQMRAALVQLASFPAAMAALTPSRFTRRLRPEVAPEPVKITA